MITGPSSAPWAVVVWIVAVASILLAWPDKTGAIVSAGITFIFFVLCILAAAYNLWKHEKECADQSAMAKENSRKNKKIRDQLGIFMREGKALLNRCDNETQPHPVDEITAWDERAKKYLGNIDLSFQESFSNPAGIAFGKNAPQPGTRHADWEGIRVRLYRLNEFIAKYSD